MIISIQEYSDYLGLTIINKYGNKEVLIDKSDYDKIKELNWNIMPDKCALSCGLTLLMDLSSPNVCPVCNGKGWIKIGEDDE